MGKADDLTITVFYTCQDCGLQHVICVVPARQDDDVRVWMDRTVRLVAADHRRRSPRCQAQSLTELRIPMTGTDRIGGVAVQ